MNIKSRWIYGLMGTIALVFSSVIYAWSVFSVPIAQEFSSWTQLQLSFVFTTAMTCFCISGLIGGFLLRKGVPFKVNMLLAAVLILIGFLTTSRAGSNLQMCLGFGVLVGLGAGFSYNSVLSTVTRWFPDKQGLISGVLLMGFGLGSFIVGIAYQSLTTALTGGWRSTFRGMGLVIFVLLFLSAFLIKAPSDTKMEETTNSLPSTTPKEMLKSPSFYFYYLWTLFLSAAGLILVSQASSIVLEISPSISRAIIPTIAGLLSIFNGVGRVVVGGLYDRKGYRFTMTLTTALFVCTSGLLLTALGLKSFPFLILGFIVGGLSYGGITPTNSAFANDFFGNAYYSINFSIICTNLIFSSFGSSVSGALYDKTGSYTLSVFAILLLAALSFVCLYFLQKKAALNKTQVALPTTI